MVGLDVENHRVVRMQVMKGAIVLTRFGHQQVAATTAPAPTDLGTVGSHDERGIEPRLDQHVTEQAGGGALAVGAGDGHTRPPAHQVAEHLGVFENPHPPAPGLRVLGMVGTDRRRCHQKLAIDRHAGRGLLETQLDPIRLQGFGYGGGLMIGAGANGACAESPSRRALSTVVASGIAPISRIWVQR